MRCGGIAQVRSVVVAASFAVIAMIASSARGADAKAQDGVAAENALAAAYTAKAAKYDQTAAVHRQKAASYAQARAASKDRGKDADSRAMQARHEALAAAADRMAANARKAADLHTLRARQLSKAKAGTAGAVP